MVEQLQTDDSLRLPALLHDAHEAYWGFGDVVRPAKKLDAQMKLFLERHASYWDSVIAKRFRINPELMAHPLVKHADNVALATEVRDLMTVPSLPWEKLPEPHFDLIEAWDIDESYRRFSSRLYELWGE